MFEVCTTLCPNTPMMLAQGDAFREFYEAQRKAGRRLWLYSCSGPAKLLDPIAYHRAQKWWAMRVGATGSFYWALGCAGGSGNSWNAYAQTGVEYSPFFVGPTSVMTGKHMEAIREGIQDFEYFVMLRERVRALAARGVAAERIAKAKQLLAEAPVQVTTAIEPGSLNWSVKKDRHAHGPPARPDARRTRRAQIDGGGNRTRPSVRGASFWPGGPPFLAGTRRSPAFRRKCFPVLQRREDAVAWTRADCVARKAHRPREDPVREAPWAATVSPGHSHPLALGRRLPRSPKLRADFRLVWDFLLADSRPGRPGGRLLPQRGSVL